MDFSAEARVGFIPFAMSGFLRKKQIQILGICFLLITIFSHQSISQVDANVVGLWSMNQSSGSTLIDQSGNGLTGSFIGPLSFVPSSAYPGAGNALNFPGNSYVRVSPNAVLNTMQNSMTIEAWVYQTDNVNNTIVD